MEAIWQHLDPVLDHLKTCDLADKEATERSLAARFGDLPELRELCRAHAAELCPNEAGSTRFGRLAKDRGGFSVDCVLSRGKGMRHKHPAGEINFCFAHEGKPTFDGDPPGWIVYPPGTTHPADVKGGAMFMIYFLPGGRIEWLKG
ncbi:MAG TPA: DUF4863 family protein [Planctomycetota bacterium]|nr:DUF4863 family protein [Planctomycetota bacterium]